ncbi:M24 family metallopeptidase [Saccharopolyspora phatthalungensis]|uniref:Xaa-Pro aminopeptidase n=1 Tax=Saccharopolyspora phatthalungensis TaxID=664693 RepID=A0A840QI07_9PSEU|nr:Xaa-Pro peptidase family protein [Saccharopolyspora phatthalungensis]MBB5159881.1 Xaa-Pro aminopeptidase [Saccharopolyspora phatthalungensis]
MTAISVKTPPRGFPAAEFEQRTSRAQRAMREHGLDALLVTAPQQVRYFTGFDTQFWESPTRPWYVVVPAAGAPVAVIPEIGEPGMRATWVTDVRTWPAPNPGDDGVSLLAGTLRELAGAGGTVGAELGPELQLRMPAGQLPEIADRAGVTITDGSAVIRYCRHVKSELEIDKIRFVCQLASDAYAQVPELIRAGDTERAVVQRMRADLITRGADTSPYLIGVSGPGGYDNIIMGPTDRALDTGDVLIIDTGTVFDGYFCDFDRNWAIGTADDAVRRAYEAVWHATEAGIAAARPGVRVCDLWKVMADELAAAGSARNNVGRLGHGLGLQLTEPPSNHPDDETVLEAGTVLAIEPGMEFAPGRMMVHEENIVIREHGAELLTTRAAPELTVVS